MSCLNCGKPTKECLNSCYADGAPMTLTCEEKEEAATAIKGLLAYTHEQGTKHDDGKPDFTFVSYELLETMARVRAFGAKKYSRSNWKKGFKVTRSLAAALRHIYAFLRGETNDPESGLSHLGHAACAIEHAIYDMQHHPANDDRDTNETSK